MTQHESNWDGFRVPLIAASSKHDLETSEKSTLMLSSPSFGFNGCTKVCALPGATPTAAGQTKCSMCACATVIGLLCLCSPLLCCAFCRDATAALLAVANGPSAATMWHRQLRVSRGEIELTLDGNVDDDTVA